MKIMIDVPEKVYDRFCRCNRFPDEVEEAIVAITDGTLLPKGHGRLIDADRLKSMYSINRANFNTVVGIQKWIDDAPTIIEADKAEGGKE